MAKTRHHKYQHNNLVSPVLFFLVLKSVIVLQSPDYDLNHGLAHPTNGEIKSFVISLVRILSAYKKVEKEKWKENFHFLFSRLLDFLNKRLLLISSTAISRVIVSGLYSFFRAALIHHQKHRGHIDLPLR